jgi:hypothetical protein
LNHIAALRQRHLCYTRLLGLSVLLMIFFALPGRWSRLTAIGYNLLPLVMIRGLGQPLGSVPFTRWPRWLYRALGLATLASGLGWYLSPLSFRSAGVLMLVLWTLFMGWSTVRLVRGLGYERRVNTRVLMGAFAGYLLIGLTAGLLFSVIESIHSGSFSSVHGAATGSLPLSDVLSAQGTEPAWQLNFVRLNYFAFVSLTTVGFGDITPLTSQAQMASVAVSVIGTLYLAVVMGLLISRATVQVEEAVDDPIHRHPHHHGDAGDSD